MNTKRLISTLTLATCLASSSMALAAPTSQFGFKGWPYRQSTSCGTQNQQSAPCESQKPESVYPTRCPQQPNRPTVQPTATPWVTPEVTQTPVIKPSETPIATPITTASPVPTATVAPTSKPVPTVSNTPVVTVSPTVKPTVPSTGNDYTSVTVSAQEENALMLLNQDRIANGRSALPLDPALSRLARIKSNDMFTNGYFAHTSPTLGNAATMLRTYGYSFTSVGENIAHHATVEKAQAAFMSSTGHRTNILGSQWSKVGIGVCYDQNGYVYVTQLFVR